MAASAFLMGTADSDFSNTSSGSALFLAASAAGMIRPVSSVWLTHDLRNAPRQGIVHPPDKRLERLFVRVFFRVGMNAELGIRPV